MGDGVMANNEQVALLKTGVSEWNEWRERHPQVQISLGEADLMVTNLRGANLRGVDLMAANLCGANLSTANLCGADLRTADLGEANLMGADLRAANLIGANFSRADLSGAIIQAARMGYTSFADVDLSPIKGLETVQHRFPSSVGIDTIYKSKGNIPDVFLRGCGVPENFIAFMHSLTGKAFEFCSCFISYASQDEEFAKRLHADLQDKGIRVWFAPEDLKIGARIQDAIEDAIRLYDKLLIVLSRNSIESAWVDHEIQTALEKEKQQKRTVLFPVRLDDAVMDTTQQWAYTLKRERNIGNFSKWKNHDDYKKSFARLVKDLQADSAKP